MNARWTFREMARGEMNIDPIQSEFFTTEAIEGQAEAVVREAIQNSLDAALPGKKVAITFRIAADSERLDPKNHKLFFHGLEEHVSAEDVGLLKRPSAAEPISFLVIEDFQTRGLTGDPAQAEDRPGTSNDFFYFFRNVGRSKKGERDRGRWGLGKNVFPAASRLNSFLAITCRHDDHRKLLMGQSVLKVHNAGGRRYYPYGFYGTAEHDGFVMPIEDKTIIGAAVRDFRLSRKDEAGLSIVIPYPDRSIDFQSILRAVIRQFFFAVCGASLVVEVVEGKAKTVLDDSSLPGLLEKMDDDFKRDLAPMVTLSQYAIETPGDQLIQVRPIESWPADAKEAVAEEALRNAKEQYHEGRVVGFRIPVTITPDLGRSESSYFAVYMSRDRQMAKHRPLYIREGLVISDATKDRLTAVRAMAVMEDQNIVTFLGDAENPAHTEWQERSGHFKDKYRNGVKLLRFVKSSVAALSAFITRSAEESDPDLFADMFFLEGGNEAGPDGGSRKRLAGPTRLGPVRLPEAVQKFRIAKIAGGFSVSLSGDGGVLPKKAEIRMAYDVRGGNPFRRYQTSDFELGTTGIEVSVESGEIEEAAGNRLLVAAIRRGFSLRVRGFDGLRDLAVAVSEM